MSAPPARLIVVLGVGHSGTTIAYRMLAMHPAVTWFSQYSLRTGDVPGRRSLPLGAWLDTSLRRVFPHDWRKRRGRLRRLLAPVPSEAHTIWRYLLPAGESDSVTERAGRVRAAVTAQCARADRRVLLVKLSRLAYHLDALTAAVPDVRYVHVIRDGRAVAASLTRKRAFRGGNGSGLLRAAEHWRDEIRTIGDRSVGAPVVELRYEDVCDDVRGALGPVLEAVDLDRAVFPFDRVPARLASTNAARIAAVAPELLARVEQIQGPWLRRFRYLDAQPAPR